MREVWLLAMWASAFYLLCKIVRMIAGEISKRKIAKKEIFWPEYESQKRQALQFARDLRSKILDMQIDESPYFYWWEIIPLCAYADEWMRETGQECHNLEKIAKEKSMEA